MRNLNIDKRWRFFLDGEEKWWRSPNPEQRKAEYRAALVSLEEYRRRDKVCDERTGYRREGSRSDELCTAMCNLQWQQVVIPAPDVQALNWKLDLLFSEGIQQEEEYCDGIRTEYIVAVLVDVRRLAGEARA